MAMRLWCVLALVAATAACASGTDPAAPADPEPARVAVTRWTDKTELFAEYPPLATGGTSRFSIHLTRLDTFKPLTEGHVEVQLRGGDAPEIFSVDSPSRPGIFGVDVRPAKSGKRELVIVLRSAGVQDEHQVGPVQVHSDSAAARAAGAPEQAAGISFLKEQQWALDFGTSVVRQEAVQESIRVPAQIAPRPDGSADVVAPIDGRLVMAAAGSVGSPVSRGQELARLQPTAAVPGDLPQLQREHAQAQAALDLAVRDRERAQRLVAAGASPQKRMDDAAAEEAQARARLTAADASLAQYNAARTGSGGAGAGGLFTVRAPIAGVIA
ncbi:MAG: efflux RND transporter periplasmic adaptor subunit, partial [Vicinamibacterales bacterium]